MTRFIDQLERCLTVCVSARIAFEPSVSGQYLGSLPIIYQSEPTLILAAESLRPCSAFSGSNFCG